MDEKTIAECRAVVEELSQPIVLPDLPPEISVEALRKNKVPEGVSPVTFRNWRAKLIAFSRARGLRKAKATLKLMQAEKELVAEKVKMGMPITPEEQRKLDWTQNESTKQKEERIVDQASRLVIKSSSVEELRMVVERTAARHGYNPIEALIKLARPDGGLDVKDQVAVHKALLPFLVPTAPTPKPGKGGESSDGKKVKVTIARFEFPEDRRTQPLHAERPVLEVDAVETEGAAS